MVRAPLTVAQTLYETDCPSSWRSSPVARTHNHIERSSRKLRLFEEGGLRVASARNADSVLDLEGREFLRRTGLEQPLDALGLSI